MTQHRSDRDRSPRPRPRSAGASRSGSATRGAVGGPPKRRPKPASADGRPTQARRPSPRGGRVGQFLKGLLIVTVLLVIAVGVTGCAVYTSMSSQLPDPDITKARGRDQTTVIYDRAGKTLAKLYAEENRQVVSLGDMPEQLKQAVIATEDRRFYEHTGVDPLGIARAVYTDIKLRDKAQGGSTITQQYVKQAFVTSEKTLKRKIQEAILAQRVERRYTKDQILANYLNTIYFGHGAYGVEAAARVYFGKGVSKLTLAESAMIAGVIKSPGRYSPYLEPQDAAKRRSTVLTQMRAQGYIDDQQLAEALASPVEVSGLKPTSTKAPYFVEWIKSQLVSTYGEHAVYRGGLRVHTTLDPKAQAAAEKAVKDVLDRKGDPSAALVAIKPGTGEVLAMVGGRDFETQQFNVAVQGRRQPGSSFKPFVLATALASGQNPEKAYKSGATKLKVGNQTWSVSGHKSPTGTMRLRPATEQSVNSVFAQLILEIGADKVAATAKDMGIETAVEPVPAIALGGLTHGVTPLEMANAYATLAAGGKRAKVLSISSVEGPDGEVIDHNAPKATRAMDAAVAFLTTDILKGVIARGTGKGAKIGRPAAGKTGTTQEYRDAWFVGYTPDVATAVWVGYPESQREMQSVHGRAVTGGSFPAQIWAQFMRAAHKGIESHSFQQPEGLTTVKVCSESGGLATEYCPAAVSALVLTKNQPEGCGLHTVPIEVAVPTLVGLAKEDALAQLDKLTLTAQVTEKPVPGVAPGIVSEQTPVAGTKVKPNSAVTLVVSAGAASNQAPQPAFAVSAGPRVGQTVSFDAAGSIDDGTITTFYWEFGDGTTGTGKASAHTYGAPGTFEVTLWVTDDAGQQASLTRPVAVK